MLGHTWQFLGFTLGSAQGLLLEELRGPYVVHRGGTGLMQGKLLTRTLLSGPKAAVFWEVADWLTSREYLLEGRRSDPISWTGVDLGLSFCR